MTGYRAHITGGFLKHYMDIIAHQALPYQWQVLSGMRDKNPTVRNFQIAAGEINGSFSGVPYQDTDLAKWLDAVGCVLQNGPDRLLEQTADAIIETIVRAQDPDGYLDTYYQLVCPEKKWTDPESHELYCFGHMIEAGVSYYEGTRKRSLLDVACRLADHVDRVFGPNEGQLHSYRGHEIIEMALMRLNAATGEARYSRLAEYLVAMRRDHPELFYRDGRREGNPLDYGCWGWGDPQRELSSYEHVTGHAVRAMYLYCGMADVARETGDTVMAEHCDRLFHDVTDSQMYITGGIGTTAVLEAYTYPYDLPNDTMYAETCASIGLCFFARRMLGLKNDRAYADTVERCVYNILPDAISQDGCHYFYVNPLEVNEEACLKSPLKTHVKSRRQSWYECACCPPNLARMLASLPQYLYTVEDRRVNIHLYAQSEAEIELNDGRLRISQMTDYPFGGRIVFSIGSQHPLDAAIALRIPQWCERYHLTVDGEPVEEAPLVDGYRILERSWGTETEICLVLEISPEWIQTNPRVREDAGKVAMAVGPVVYCTEEADNGPLLSDLMVDTGTPLETMERNDVSGFGSYPAFSAAATRSSREAAGEKRLYFPLVNRRRQVSMTLIPYCLWGERENGEMAVWLQGR